MNEEDDYTIKVVKEGRKRWSNKKVTSQVERLKRARKIGKEKGENKKEEKQTVDKGWKEKIVQKEEVKAKKIQANEKSVKKIEEEKQKSQKKNRKKKKSENRQNTDYNTCNDL